VSFVRQRIGGRDIAERQRALTTDSANSWLIEFDFGLKMQSFTAQPRGHIL